MAAPAGSCLTLESLREISLAGPTEMLALLKKVAADVMACEKGVDAKKKAEAVCQKILDMLDDVEKAGKVCLEGSIEKEKTTAVLAVVSQLKELVKSHLPMILCPPPFVSQVLSRLAELFSGCLSKAAVLSFNLHAVLKPCLQYLSSLSRSRLDHGVTAARYRKLPIALAVKVATACFGSRGCPRIVSLAARVLS